VQSMDPPGKMCDYQRCLKGQERFDKACKSRHWSAGHPYLLDNPETPDDFCYCCCSCFAGDSSIATGADETKAIGDISVGDTVQAAVIENGLIVGWKDVAVETSTALPPLPESEASVLAIRYGLSDTDYQTMAVTSDHLFLQPGGKLIPAAALNRSDVLLRADNSTVAVRFMVPGAKSIAARVVATGPFTGSDLSGHLLNVNAVVSADLAVQVAYVTGQLAQDLLIEGLDGRLRAGSREYLETFSNEESDRFVADPETWPTGFKPA
jgi:hypothetical protein